MALALMDQLRRECEATVSCEDELHATRALVYQCDKEFTAHGRELQQRNAGASDAAPTPPMFGQRACDETAYEKGAAASPGARRLRVAVATTTPGSDAPAVVLAPPRARYEEHRMLPRPVGRFGLLG